MQRKVLRRVDRLQQQLLQQQEQQEEGEGEREEEGGEEHSAADEEGSQFTLNRQQQVDELMASIPPESKITKLSCSNCSNLKLSCTLHTTSPSGVY